MRGNDVDDNTHARIAELEVSDTIEQRVQQNVARIDGSGEVDLATLRQNYNYGTSLHSDPDIWLFDDVATPDEMTALIDGGREILKRAEVSGETGGFVSPGRSGSNCWIRHNHDELTLRLAERISEIVRIPLSNAESFQLVHYGPGEQYRPHYDAWRADTSKGERCLARGGQRLITALLYLSEVEAGGATSFPELGIEVRAAPGRMVLFHNCHPGTNRVHEGSLHGGMPVEIGEKWATNLWFRERVYR
jgi:prolyl 4-hydroxylase